jgi:aspartate/methionine/tyrosine aminotransferase
MSWILGPSAVIDAVTSAGSFLDGGANHPFQRPAAALLDPDLARRETAAIQRAFLRKRVLMIDRLRAMGVRIEAEPAGAFYVWGDLADLPAPLNDGFEFFQRGLREKVITVPGVFFDVNPGQRRRHARYQSFCRFSFGPALEKIERGLAALERMVAAAR